MADTFSDLTERLNTLLARFGDLKSRSTPEGIRAAQIYQLQVMRLYRDGANAGAVPKWIGPIPPQADGNELLIAWSKLAGTLAQSFPGQLALREDMGTLAEQDGRPVVFATREPNTPEELRDWHIGWVEFAEDVVRLLIKSLPSASGTPFPPAKRDRYTLGDVWKEWPELKGDKAREERIRKNLQNRAKNSPNAGTFKQLGKRRLNEYPAQIVSDVLREEWLLPTK